MKSLSFPWTLSSLLLLPPTQAFITPPPSSLKHTILHLQAPNEESTSSSRYQFLQQALTLPSAFLLTNTLSLPTPASALVKGNAPPPKKKVSDSPKIQCTTIDECQEKTDKLIAQEQVKAMEESASDDIKVAPKGSRYRDLQAGNLETPTAQPGDKVELYYKVLKLGKRSYDGLSGEGTVVFSRGYNLEDDETSSQRDSFTCQLGSPQIISALSDAIPGMHIGTIRRISVSPQMGWEVPTKDCDGGPGGSGTGGELKTDYVVVPTATMVSTESCFAKDKLPFPKTYAEQRRMAQRFDQSLIVEVELAKIY